MCFARWKNLFLVGILVLLFSAGCHKKDECAALHQTLVDSEPWARLQTSATHCLSSDELTLLNRYHDSPAWTLELYLGKTVDEVIRQQRDIEAGVNGPENPIAQIQAQESVSPAGQQSRSRRDTALDIMQSSVVFIYQSQNPKIEPLAFATGFLVALKSKTRPGSWLQLVVTARHVVDPNWPTCLHALQPNLYVRLNKPNYDPAVKGPGVAFESLKLFVDGNRQYFLHRDDGIDLAVVLLTPQDSPNFASYGINSLPMTSIETPTEMQQLRVGAPVMSLGLVPGFAGVLRNHPILKPGVIASIPNESFEIGFDCDGRARTMKAWLIASHMNEGSSGAPVYDWSGPLPTLLGVQSFALHGIEPGQGYDTPVRVDYDVAGIIPVTSLYELIQDMKITDADISLRDSPRK